MKLYAMRKLQQRRALVEGRWIIGIDPAKVRHDAVLVDPYGLPAGRSFSFAHNPNGFNSHLWKRLEDRLPHFAGTNHSLDAAAFRHRLLYFHVWYSNSVTAGTRTASCHCHTFRTTSLAFSYCEDHFGLPKPRFAPSPVALREVGQTRRSPVGQSDLDETLRTLFRLQSRSG